MSRKITSTVVGLCFFVADFVGKEERILTEKKRIFIETYINDIKKNKTAAAIAAGYSEKTAAQAASRLMKDAEVAAAIEERMKELHEQNTAKADEVVEFLTAVMRGDKDIDNVPLLVGEGLQKLIKASPGAKDRIKAAEMLGKYYALFTDKLDTDGDLNFKIAIDYGEDNEADNS